MSVIVKANEATQWESPPPDDPAARRAWGGNARVRQSPGSVPPWSSRQHTANDHVGTHRPDGLG